VNFGDPCVAEQEELAMPDAEILAAPRIPLIRQWCQPSARDRKKMEERVKKAPLISCHSFYRYHNFWTLRMKEKYGVPYWFVPHGGLDPYVMESGALAKKIFSACGGARFLKEASCVIFSTEAEWQKAETVFGELKGEVVPWPVQMLVVEDKLGTRNRVRHQLGIPMEDSVLVYFGRIHSMKRPLETIQAVAELSSPNLHLLMIGPEGDVDAETCRSLATELKFDRLHVIGPVFGSEKAEWLLAGDAYVSLSNRENFNHSAAECLSLGLPVILSKGNDLSGHVREADCGWCAEEDGPNAWRHLLEAFLKDQESGEWLAKGKRGQYMIQHSFSFESFQSRIQGLLLRYGRYP